MSIKHTSDVFRTGLPKISHDEVARLISEAERMRAEHVAGLFRSAGRRLAHFAQATLAALRMPRPSKGIS